MKGVKMNNHQIEARWVLFKIVFKEFIEGPVNIINVKQGTEHCWALVDAAMETGGDKLWSDYEELEKLEKLKDSGYGSI